MGMGGPGPAPSMMVGSNGMPMPPQPQQRLPPLPPPQQMGPASAPALQQQQQQQQLLQRQQRQQQQQVHPDMVETLKRYSPDQLATVYWQMHNALRSKHLGILNAYATRSEEAALSSTDSASQVSAE